MPPKSSITLENIQELLNKQRDSIINEIKEELKSLKTKTENMEERLTRTEGNANTMLEK